MADGPIVHRVADARLPTEFGDFRCLAYQAEGDDVTHLALVRGDPRVETEPVLVRLHSECLTGDVFSSRRCDCGPQLHAAMRLVAQAGTGVVVYLCGHEGRGIGIAHKLQAYELQDDGFDTVDANLELGLPVDDRDYGIGAAILHDLGVDRIQLLTNNPAKTTSLAAAGITISGRLPLVTAVHDDNAAYLRTKAERLGHRYEPDE
jgi:3,4-dihydroxy 2-butanone 4-phosphate synthase/GTP cyclohydrolase II